MAKSIKVQAVVVDGFSKVMFKVLNQSNTGYSFGNSYCDSRKFTASNGITLASNVRPARDADDKTVIWLRGSDASKNDGTVVVTLKEWNLIKAAIEEYNKTFADVAPVAAPSCGVIVG